MNLLSGTAKLEMIFSSKENWPISRILDIFTSIQHSLMDIGQHDLVNALQIEGKWVSCPWGSDFALGKRGVLELMGSPWIGDWWWRDPPCGARRLGKKEKIGRFRARAHQLLGLSAEHQSAPLCLFWCSAADDNCPFATCSWDPYLSKISTLSFSDPVFNCRRIILQTHKLKVLSVRLHLFIIVI